jgi:hypothetical protein
MEQLLIKTRGIVNKNKKQKHGFLFCCVCVYVTLFITDQMFTLGRMSINKRKKIWTPDLQLIFNQLLFEDGF